LKKKNLFKVKRTYIKNISIFLVAAISVQMLSSENLKTYASIPSISSRFKTGYKKMLLNKKSPKKINLYQKKFFNSKCVNYFNKFNKFSKILTNTKGNKSNTSCKSNSFKKPNFSTLLSLQKYNEKKNPYSGLNNSTGSMCFANSAIQAIVRSCPKDKMLNFASKLLTKSDSLSKEFGKLIQGLVKNSASVIDTAEFAKQLQTHQIVNPYEQNDSDAFVLSLVNCFNLNSELGMFLYLENNIRLAYNSSSFPKMGAALKGCLLLGGYTGRIGMPPNFVSISLRESVARPNKYPHNLNVMEKVDLPFGPNDSDVGYKLKSFVCHWGTSFLFGHYTAFVNINDEWFQFNDGSVKLIAKKDISNYMNKDADYLIYEKIS
jgi:ubiquitin C-terminal hydrolase